MGVGSLVVNGKSVAVALGLLALVGMSCGGRIPNGPGMGVAQAFMGAPAVAKPLAPKDVPPHPLLSPVSCLHSDAYNSDVDDHPGPLGINPEVRTSFIGISPIIMFDDKGRMFSVSLDLSVIGMGITAVDPETLEVIDRYAIPINFVTLFRGGQGDQGISVNGGYFHIDAQGRAIAGTQDNRFLELELQKDERGRERWKLIREVDLDRRLKKDDLLIDTQYDWSGNVWFVSAAGVVGYIAVDDGVIKTMDLGVEFLENGVAVAEDGVFVLSSDAAYRFEIAPDDGEPRFTWRVPYERGLEVKPGTFALGSGATPTLMGDDLITFTDNADGQINLLVLRRGEDVAGERLVCKVPLFEPGASAVDVSVIAYRDSIVVENIYNAGGFVSDYRELAPGLTRVDVASDRSGCEVVWTTDEVRSTGIPKLSTKTGLIYTYTQSMDYDDPVDAWYLAAVDFETGEVVYQVLVGTGKLFPNAFGGIALGPDGTVYQGLAGGIVSVRDRE